MLPKKVQFQKPHFRGRGLIKTGVELVVMEMV